MLKKVDDANSPKFRGLNTNPNILALDKEHSPNIMDIKVNYDGSFEKRLGSNVQNALVIAASAVAAFSPNVSTTLTSSLQSFWKLDEASGSRADIYGSVTLSDFGGTTFASGIKNQAALFNAATNQALFATNPPTLTGNANFSVSTWFYLNSTSITLQRTLVSKSDYGTAAADASTKLLIHADSGATTTSFMDASSSAHTITANNSAVIDTSQYEFGGGSVKLAAATSDALSITGTVTDFNIGASDFTFEGWVRPTAPAAAGSNLTMLEQITNDNNNSYMQLYLTPINNGFYPTVYAQTAGGAGTFTGSGTIIVNTGQWSHVAFVRSNNTFSFYVNGSGSGSVRDDLGHSTVGGLASGTYVIDLGAHHNSAAIRVSQFYDGWMDEIRFSTVPRFTSNFSVPTSAYNSPTSYEYWLYVDTDNKVAFDVSSSGLASNGSVKATSFGVVTTSTWYNAVAWVNAASSQIGISVNLSATSAAYASGLKTASAPFTLGGINGGGSLSMDGRLDETGYWSKVLNSAERVDLYNSGTGNTYQRAYDNSAWASYDFGASSLRWLVCAAGTGLYASSNLGITWMNIGTSQTATYQYFERSKNVLVATSEAYDTPLYWAGSLGTFAAVLNNSAPSCKYSVNFQGFLILLNSSARKRGFFYNDENTQLTGAWTNNFDLPSSYDDEITATFVLRRYLYISTRYALWRISYVGGNPDWQFIKIKEWGFIPRTAKKVTITNPSLGNMSYSIGEVVIGLTWDRKIRIFDGSGDQIISNDIEKDNGVCDFSVEKIGYLGSGPIVSFAETDNNQNVYKLIIALGQNSQQTTHMINFDARGLAWYPYQNQAYNTMVMAESANQRFLMAFDRSGFCHMLDSGNLDANKRPVNDVFESPILFTKSPSQSHKSHRTDIFFSNLTSGTVHYDDRIDFSVDYMDRGTKFISGSDRKIIIHVSHDAPETYNGYQFRISSSSGTNSPYRVIRYDHFAEGLGIGKND